MMLIDEPSVGQGLEVWQKHLTDLQKLSPKYQRDKSVVYAIKRAKQIIQLTEEYNKQAVEKL